jgi:hypothetical protein
MKRLLRGVVAGAVIAIVGLTGFTAFTFGDSQSSLLDNLYLSLMGGFEKQAGEDSTAFGSVGANWGIPLTPQRDGAVFGLQVGGDAELREDNPEYGFTVGLFGRNFKSFGDQQAALALLADYRHTASHNDLWSLSPVVGTTINANDAVGLTGTIALNRDHHTKGTDTIHEEAINRVDAFWNHEWNRNLATELSGGYQFSRVDAGIFGAQVVYTLNSHLDLALGGEINTRGDHAVGISATYKFGGTSSHSTIHNIRGTGAGLYTPFPTRGFAATVQHAAKLKRSSPATGGGGTGGGGSGSGGSGSGGSGGGTSGGGGSGSGGSGSGGSGGGTSGGGGSSGGGSGGGTSGGGGSGSGGDSNGHGDKDHHHGDGHDKGDNDDHKGDHSGDKDEHAGGKDDHKGDKGDHDSDKDNHKGNKDGKGGDKGDHKGHKDKDGNDCKGKH